MDTTMILPRPRRLVQSIGAVLAGVLINVMFAIGTDAVLHATGIYPPWFQPMADHLWLLALAYRFVFGVAGGLVTARLAPTQPMRHVLVLLGIGVLLGVLGVLANWNKGPEYGPHWFSISLVVSGAIATWLGGVMHSRLVARRQS